MAISSSELRIGNYVNTPNAKQNPFRVDFFDRSKVYQYNGTYEVPGFGTVPFHELTWDLEDITGIPLTPEILELAGFEKYEDVSGFKRLPCWRNNFIGVEYRASVKLYTIVWYDANDDYGTTMASVRIKYLHQLQNIFHSLCGEELVVNL